MLSVVVVRSLLDFYVRLCVQVRGCYLAVYYMLFISFALLYDKFLFLLLPLLSAFTQSSLAFCAAAAKIFVIRRVYFALNLILKFKSDTSDIGHFQLSACNIIGKFYHKVSQIDWCNPEELNI